VRQTTTYVYESAVTSARHVLRLFPVTWDCQRVTAAMLGAQPFGRSLTGLKRWKPLQWKEQYLQARCRDFFYPSIGGHRLEPASPTC